MPIPINLADLGRRARAIRVARGLTLEEVVQRAEFTASWLSKLENGLLSPSLEGLVKLADVLECGVDELVEGLSVRPRHVVVRKGQGRVETSRDRVGETQLEQLADAWQGRGMNPVILHVSPANEAAGSVGRSSATSHFGELFLLVLSGAVRLEYGVESIQLMKGDSIYLDATIPHRMAASNRAKASVLSVSFEPSRNGFRTGFPAASRQRTPGGRARSRH